MGKLWFCKGMWWVILCKRCQEWEKLSGIRFRDFKGVKWEKGGKRLGGLVVGEEMGGGE